MARPNDEERRGREQRRAANQRARDETHERDKMIRTRVDRLVSDALDRSKRSDDLPDRAEIIARLEEARHVALSCWPPQCQAAANCAMYEAKLLGYVIEQTAVGSPEEFPVLTGSTEEAERAVIERLRERVGSKATDRFVAMIRDMRDEGVIIESKSEPSEDED
jgi:hypothetical protein